MNKTANNAARAHSIADGVIPKAEALGNAMDEMENRLDGILLRLQGPQPRPGIASDAIAVVSLIDQMASHVARAGLIISVIRDIEAARGGA